MIKSTKQNRKSNDHRRKLAKQIGLSITCDVEVSTIPHASEVAGGIHKGCFRLLSSEKITFPGRPSKRQPIVLRCPRSLKGELTYSSFMNLAVSRCPAGGKSNMRPQQRAPGTPAVPTRWVKMKAYFAFL